jgi:Cof subfamily protein (haloacid dehalogenase superfamily)
MDLVVFDLDGTLLNKVSQISTYTEETLQLLQQRDIAYTVATGRTRNAASDILLGQGFVRPHIYKNGVMIWNPTAAIYSHQYLLSEAEISPLLTAFTDRDVTPFVFTLERKQHHGVYHPPIRHDVERRLAKQMVEERGFSVQAITELPAGVGISNISALGDGDAIAAVVQSIEADSSLVAYTGVAIEDQNLCWVDIHHRDGSKGDAVSLLKREMGASRVLCFGDSDNDMSMFMQADECYAPENAKPEIKQQATEVIGHHDEDGIARFLRRRFDL